MENRQDRMQTNKHVKPNKQGKHTYSQAWLPVRTADITVAPSGILHLPGKNEIRSSDGFIAVQNSIY